MPVKIEDRPTETVRDEVIDQLIMNYSHGKLSYEAFERRLDVAMSSKDNVEISALADDLDLEVDRDYIESKRRDFDPQFAPNEGDESDYMVNIFGGSDRSGRWKVAKRVEVCQYFWWQYH